MKNSKLLSLSIALLVVFLAACASSQNNAPQQKTEHPTKAPVGSNNLVRVSIKDFKFAPADVTVKVGDSVEWTNEDSAQHTVESSDGTLKSDELSKGDTYKFTFEKTGKYNYICGIHKSMHGSVTVQ